LENVKSIKNNTTYVHLDRTIQEVLKIMVIAKAGA
jgi:hypothetical protein